MYNHKDTLFTSTHYTVGEDYHLSKRRVELIPGVNNNTGKVKLKIVNDYYPEEDEQLLVQLELKTGSASVDYHSAMVVIIGGQGNVWADVLRLTASHTRAC